MARIDPLFATGRSRYYAGRVVLPARFLFFFEAVFDVGAVA